MKGPHIYWAPRGQHHPSAIPPLKPTGTVKVVPPPDTVPFGVADLRDAVSPAAARPLPLVTEVRFDRRRSAALRLDFARLPVFRATVKARGWAGLHSRAPSATNGGKK